MNKRLLLLPILSLAGSLYAQPNEKRDPELERIVDEAKVVVYTITIYKDAAKEVTPQWRTVINHAVRAIRETENKNDTWVLEMCRSLVESQKDNSNVHGEIRISVGNGECPEGGCLEPCKCKERYRGVCPCSAGAACCD